MLVLQSLKAVISRTPEDDQRRPSVNNEQVLAGCIGKAVFPSFKAAEKRAKVMRRRDDSKVAAYRCKRCSKWHVGEAWELPEKR